MDKEKQAEYTVNGFRFGSKEDVEAAQQELSAVQYINHKIENHNGETVLSVYQAAIDKKMFRTPIGYSYLHDLQKRMIQEGIDKERIQGIPLFQIYNNTYKDEIKPVRVVKRIKKKDETKQKYYRSLIANVVLVILVVALFIISMTGNNPTIMNYRQKVENQYAEWEQELNQRETVVREKEKELNIKK